MEDVLEDRRTKSDWCWIMKRYTPTWYAVNQKHILSADIKEDVLASPAVQYAIDQLAHEKRLSRLDLEMEASAIVDSMGHMFTVKAIRFFGLLLAKVFKRLYSSIEVNTDGLEAVRRVAPTRPILLMPTHRSYVDFLIISYVFFHYNLPVPIIAAGQDFASMKVMGRLMRHAGAFFIRRTFGGDRLYWAVFAEYVATLVASGGLPLEFFVEGARSRSAKPLFPKYGLLASALEPYFKARVPDIAIVPISIAYDRTLEESLHIHEMLGVPKPKESTTGLLKAFKILGDNFGSVKMIVGEPISMMEFCGDRVDRSLHNCAPRHLSPMTLAERELVTELAHHVIDHQRRMLPIRPFVVIAAAARVAISMAAVEDELLEVSYDRLALDVRWLIGVLEHLGVTVDWPGNKDPIETIHNICSVHENVVDKTKNNVFRVIKCPQRVATSFHQLDFNSEASQYVVTMNAAVGNLMLDYYGNQVLHVFVNEGILALILHHSSSGTSPSKEWVYSEYCFLARAYRLEFVIRMGNSEKSFDRAVHVLTKLGALTETDGQFTVNPDAKIIEFLATLFRPFLLGYHIVCQELLAPSTNATDEFGLSSAKELAKRAQRLAVTLLTSISGLRHQYAVLSLELLANGVHSLESMEIIVKKPARQEGLSLYQPVHHKLLDFIRRLDPYTTSAFGNRTFPFDLMAKL